MGERYYVRIDVGRIQSNMLRDEGGKLSERQIHNWLISAGFTPDQSGGWIADRDALRQLDRSEVLETKPVRRSRAPRAHGRGEPHQSAERVNASAARPRANGQAKHKSKRPEH